MRRIVDTCYTQLRRSQNLIILDEYQYSTMEVLASTFNSQEEHPRRARSEYHTNSVNGICKTVPILQKLSFSFKLKSTRTGMTEVECFNSCTYKIK